MKEKWEEFRVSLSDTASMSKKEYLLTLAVCILGGILFGMLCSPKKSIVIGSNNGNNSGNGRCNGGEEEETGKEEISDEN